MVIPGTSPSYMLSGKVPGLGGQGVNMSMWVEWCYREDYIREHDDRSERSACGHHTGMTGAYTGQTG